MNLNGLLVVIVFCIPTLAGNAQEARPNNHADANLANYFEAETKELADACLTNLSTLEDWQTKQKIYRQQLFDMLGLDPIPAKTDLKPEITQTVECDEFKVHSLHFQSSPGLYVTGNLYVPAEVKTRLPAILYVCGHARIKKNGINYGNKVSYHHHGCWFARNGYVCLTIDTLQLGEIEGIHHGTYRHKMWWWLNRGYTPAGVEAWNCIRALDYLQSRPEVDPEKLGVTGRSGGGAYSWWIAALDERIKVAVPVAGITDLQNHVVDGCVEGHCDCMYFLNTHRWDYPLAAALVAPRPLLISNTDNDRIFPLDGVYRTYQKVRKVYQLYGKEKDIALHITAGPHNDTQELRIHAFRWFNHYLKDSDEPVRIQADKLLEPEQLRSLQKLPADSMNGNIHDTFVKAAPQPVVPTSREQWRQTREQTVEQLRNRTFGGWPKLDSPLKLEKIKSKEIDGALVEEYRFNSQQHVPLVVHIFRRSKSEGLRTADVAIGSTSALPFRGFLHPNDEAETLEAKTQFEAATPELVRGSGLFAQIYTRTTGTGDERKQTQIRRRFYLLGQTLDGMRAYDIRRGIQAVRTIAGSQDLQVTLLPDTEHTEITAYAALFEANVKSVILKPDESQQRATLLNNARIADLPFVVTMLGDVAQVFVVTADKEHWQFPLQVNQSLNRSSVRLGDPGASRSEPGLPKE